jgi:hypothetical protein
MSRFVEFQNAESTPLNGISVYNTNAGSHQIIFELSGSSNMMLDLSSIRFVCEANVLKSSGQRVNNYNYYENDSPVQYQQAPAGGVPPNLALATQVGSGGGSETITAGYDETKQQFIDIDTRSQASSFISSIQIEDLHSNILEAIYNYPQTMNKVHSLTLSQDDMLTKCATHYGNATGGKRMLSQTALNSSKHLALKVYGGLFNSKPIPYRMVGGRVRIVVNLSAPQSCIFGGQNTPFSIGTPNLADNLALESTFRLEGVKVNYRNLILPADAPQLTEYKYLHYASLNSTINSSNDQNMLNPNTSNTLCILTSFVPSKNLNTYQANGVEQEKLKREDGLGKLHPVNIVETNFLRNNVRMPLAFPINQREQSNPVAPAIENYDVQRQYYYQSCINPLWATSKTLCNSSTENYGGFDEVKDVDTVPVYGVGIKYNVLDSRDGISYVRGNSFAQRVQSLLDGTMPNEAFSNILAQRTLRATGSGVVVIN